MKPPITLIKSDLSHQGGLEKYTWQIAADFCHRGSLVTILTTGNPLPPFSHPLLKIVSFPAKKAISYLSILAFDKACNNYLEKNPTSIVFGLDRTRFQTHLRAGNGVHAAYLNMRKEEEGFTKGISFSINPLHQTILSLEKKAFEHPELKILFTNSQMVKKEILTHYRTDPSKICVVHNGVEWGKMQIPFDKGISKREEMLSTFCLNKHLFQLLFVGHNFRRKGLEKLLYALSFIKKGDFQLSIVGEDKESSYFESLCKKLKIADKVFFFGKQPSPLPFYQMADAFVIPPFYDPFANVTLEALAMGLFTLSSKHNGGSEILTPENGQIIPNLSDYKEFSLILENIIQKKKSEESAHRIRNSVKEFDFPNQLAKITEATLSSLYTKSVIQ